MSPRHSAPRSRQPSRGRRLVVVPVVALLAVVGTVLVAARFAHPARPLLSPTVSDPAMLVETGSRDADSAREEAVSRSSARGASVSPTPRVTPATKPTTTRPPAPVTSRPRPPNTTYQQQVLDLTNQQRAKANCPALRMDPRLQQAAQGHSQDMADKDYFAHNDPDGTTPWDRAEEAGYPDPSGENIAMGYPTPANVVEAWMNSPGHRANILNCDSHDLGVGYVVDGGRGAIWTQLFGFG